MSSCTGGNQEASKENFVSLKLKVSSGTEVLLFKKKKLTKDERRREERREGESRRDRQTDAERE